MLELIVLIVAAYVLMMLFTFGMELLLGRGRGVELAWTLACLGFAICFSILRLKSMGRM